MRLSSPSSEPRCGVSSRFTRSTTRGVGFRLARVTIRRVRARLAEDERGSAALEFILAGVVLLVPIVYLVIALGLVQGQSLGAEAGARHLARAISTASDAGEARGRTHLVLASIVQEYGLEKDSVDVSITCAPSGRTCPEAGATVIVRLTTTVRLPLVPPVLGLDRITVVPVEATAVQRVSRLWGTS